MAAPTVDYIGSSVVTSDVAQESVAVTWSTGDKFVVLGMTEDQSRTFTGLPDLTGFTFTALTSDSGALPTSTGSSCKGYGWESDAAASGGSGSITISGSTFGKSISVWRVGAGTSDGIGQVRTLTSTELVVSIPRDGANSVLLAKFGDWNATSDVTVSSDPAGGTVRLATQYASRYTDYAADWPDQGAAGTTSYGIADATGTGTVTKIAVEIKGTGAAVSVARPDADLATTGWSTAPLFSKLNDQSDATVVTATLA